MDSLEIKEEKFDLQDVNEEQVDSEEKTGKNKNSEEKKSKMRPVRVLSLGYLITILIGTILLMLPFATKENQGNTSIIDALFTATSATCVTGLIPFDTFTHWSFFGQIVIICLIQIGGLGFMTIITLLFMLVGKKLSLYNRTIMMQSAGSYNISEVTKLIRRIILGTIFFEGIGALVLFYAFWQNGEGMEVKDAIYYGIFHSISAFCNAGFDIFGSTTPGGSVVDFQSNGLVLITLMSLIMIGGSGFIVWSDLLDSKLRFRKLQLHSKIVIVANAFLVVIPAILFFIFEFTSLGNNGNFTELPFLDKVLNAFFLSVSPRTAGFASLDITKLTPSGKLLTIILMFIGGNPGSTAGGVKVTTFVVVFANLIANARGNNKVVMFKRQIPSSVIKQSGSLFVAYLVMILVATMLICSFETFEFQNVLLEVVSAVGTVGLTIGVSGGGHIITKLILIFLMYTGRLGALALFSVFVNKKSEHLLEEPKGKILVG